MMRSAASFLLFLMAPAHTALAQTEPVAPAESVPISEPEAVRPYADKPSERPLEWTAATYGGVLVRDGGPTSPYAVASLTRQLGRIYLRGAVTGYKSTLVQPDVALPSTYVIGSLGAGGRFGNWLVDSYVSLGHQKYGQIETPLGSRDSQIGSGSSYFASGISAGRVFQPAQRWFVTPSLSAQYSHGKLLRHRIDAGQAIDFETDEPAWTGIAGLRVDHTLGREGRSNIGLWLSHHETGNGLSELVLSAAPGSGPGPVTVTASHRADSWEEAGGSVTIALTRRLSLDLVANRSFGALAGDSWTGSAGLKFGF